MAAQSADSTWKDLLYNVLNRRGIQPTLTLTGQQTTTTTTTSTTTEPAEVPNVEGMLFFLGNLCLSHSHYSVHGSELM